MISATFLPDCFVKKYAVILLITILMPSSTFASGMDFSLGTGIDYANGKYGASATSHARSIPLSASVTGTDWSIKAIASYISVAGSRNVVQNVGRVGGFPPGTPFSYSGWGDTLVAGSFNLYESQNTVLDMTGKVKLATGNSSMNLGTGKNDFTMAVDLYTQVGAYTAFGTLAYTTYGQPVRYRLIDGYNISAGLAQQTGTSINYGLEMHLHQNMLVTGTPYKSLSLFADCRISDVYTMQSYVLKGTGTSGPAFGFGIMLNQHFH